MNDEIEKLLDDKKRWRKHYPVYAQKDAEDLDAALRRALEIRFEGNADLEGDMLKILKGENDY